MRKLWLGLMTIWILMPLPLHAGTVDINPEYNALNTQAQQSMALSPPELKELLLRCTNLQTRLPELSGAEKKIMHRKLRRLCALFSYVLASKQSPPK
ncbi:MAG: hypothetical protein GW875_09355 [Deltaproteobacteria bacterium]|nr:hypothetical protein [Deltaproteobacteria bacterium]NCP04269.1 hypothetical protein [Deltaproteobacteria bacterium]